MNALETLAAIALDLTAGLSSKDRCDRLVAAVRRALPCDASALMRLDRDALVVVSTYGLAPDVRGRRFRLDAHPRLARICESDRPIQFPHDSALPDPFDGALTSDPTALGRVHACLGCPLRVEGELVGALTADALRADAFGTLDPRFLEALGALAGAALRTSELIEALDRAATRQGLIARDLMREVAAERGGELLGASAAMHKVRQEIELIARTEFSVLVTGETGVGKELVVRAIHARSSRRDAPLCYVNCAALSESLADSELFGHTRGAFTGAASERPGKLVVADGATLFLDEIGELPLSVQPKLLRALQQGEIQRVGLDRPIRVDLRVLAATNRNLDEAVHQGRFRADLYHRLAVYPLHVPALRQRPEDIPILAGHFAELARLRLGTGPVRLHFGLVERMTGYHWPGNVRELENAISRMVLLGASRSRAGEPIVLTADLMEARDPTQPQPPRAEPSPARIELGPLRGLLDDYQRTLIGQALTEARGNWTAAARVLGVDRGNLHRLAGRLGIGSSGS